MAYISEPQSKVANVLGAIGRLVSNLREAAQKRRTMRVTFNELSSLSARDLQDLGIDRSAIRSVAYEAAYGK